MKASKIITLGLVAASAGLIMGTVALPAQAASVDRVANVQLTNRPNSGKDGNYRALNHLSRQIKITESAPGVYKVTVRDKGLQRWLSLLGHPNLGSGASRNCTPGYSPCLPPASDYDCRGGSGNGPKYTGPVRVTGSDPYHLDKDRDGKGCERS
jgi:hypothetical protein